MVAVLGSAVLVTFTCGARSSRLAYYGRDDRIEAEKAAAEVVRERASTVAAVIPIGDLHPASPDKRRRLRRIVRLDTQYDPVCPDKVVTFHEQRVAATCTATAVSSNAVLTAKHCIPDPDPRKPGLKPTAYVFAFGFHYVDGVAPDGTFSAGQWHEGVRVMAEGAPGQDWVLVEVRQPVEPDHVGQWPVADPVIGTASFTLGYPLGLPLKHTGNGRVRGITGSVVFGTSLDSYPGGSGAPVFTHDGNLLGIIVSGHRGLVMDKALGCWRDPELGEDAPPGTQVLRARLIEPALQTHAGWPVVP